MPGSTPVKGAARFALPRSALPHHPDTIERRRARPAAHLPAHRLQWLVPGDLRARAGGAFPNLCRGSRRPGRAAGAAERPESERQEIQGGSNPDRERAPGRGEGMARRSGPRGPTPSHPSRERCSSPPDCGAAGAATGGWSFATPRPFASAAGASSVQTPGQASVAPTRAVW